MGFALDAPVFYLSNGDGFRWSAVVKEVLADNDYVICVDGSIHNGTQGPYGKPTLTVNGAKLKAREPKPDDLVNQKIWQKQCAVARGLLQAKIRKANCAGFKRGTTTTFCLRTSPGSNPHFVMGTALSGIDPDSGHITVNIDGVTTVVGLEDEFITHLQNTADISHVSVGKKVSFYHISCGHERNYDKKFVGTIVGVDSTTGMCEVSVGGATNPALWFKVHATLVLK
jgi:hypothetical protein